jgi:hypothetical protein
MRTRGWILLLLALATSLHAEPAAPAQVEAHYRQVVQRPEFHETAELESQQTWQDRIAQWLRHFGATFDQFKYAPQMSKLAGMLFSGLTLLALVGVIYVSARLLRRRYRERMIAPAAATAERPDEITELDLAQVIAQGRWRAAWRIAWKQFLASLEQTGWVAADRSRTNREYLARLDAAELPAAARPLLHELVDRYDAIIYGGQSVTEPEWRAFREEIGRAGLLLNLREVKTSGRSSA